jgi:hypothetical protein
MIEAFQFSLAGPGKTPAQGFREIPGIHPPHVHPLAADRAHDMRRITDDRDLLLQSLTRDAGLNAKAAERSELIGIQDGFGSISDFAAKPFLGWILYSRIGFYNPSPFLIGERKAFDQSPLPQVYACIGAVSGPILDIPHDISIGIGFSVK